MNKKAIAKEFHKNIFTQASTLADRHASYVDQFVSRANDELYAILAEVLALHEQVQASPEQDKLIKQIRKHLREHFNIKTQANTKTTALVTKLVTRASRKTAHVYSRVLDKAIESGVSSSGLVDFIKQHGGIDKVRLQVKDKEAQQIERNFAQQRHAAVSQHLLHKPAIGVVDLSAVKHTLPHAGDVEFLHVLCKFNYTTCQHEVVAVQYPNSFIEQRSLDDFMIMLSAAAVSDQGARFHECCKFYELNKDIVMRWMRANGINSASEARRLGRTLEQAQLSTQQHNAKAGLVSLPNAA